MTVVIFFNLQEKKTWIQFSQFEIFHSLIFFPPKLLASTTPSLVFI